MHARTRTPYPLTRAQFSCPPLTSECSPNLSEKVFFLNSEQRTAVLVGDRCALSSYPPVARRTKAIKYGNELRYKEHDHQLLKHTEEPRALQSLAWIPAPVHHFNPHFLEPRLRSFAPAGTAEMFKSLARQSHSFLRCCAYDNLSLQTRQRTVYCRLSE